MTSSPLPPPWAVRVWIEGGQFHVDCPIGEDRPSHRLTYPCDAYGMQRLRTMLTYRGPDSLLNTKGDPTQWRVDKELALLKKKVNPDMPIRKAKPKDKFTQAARATARDVLRKLGLTGAVTR